MKPRTLVLILGLAMAYDPRTGITTFDDAAADSALASDPVPAPSTATDFSAYRPYLQYAATRGDIPDAMKYERGLDGDLYYTGAASDAFLSDPSSIFGVDYSPTARHSVNPYYSTANRDALRDIAASLGLGQSDADRAALEYAQEHFNQFGQGYSDATHPNIVADAIARKLFGQVGRPYEGFSTEQTNQLINDAAEYQRRLKERDQDAWKRDDLGSVFAFEENNVGNILDELKDKPERAFIGSFDPFSTGMWNMILGRDDADIINQYGGPTDAAFEDAAVQGIDPKTSQFSHMVAKIIASYFGGQGVATGLGELGSLASVETGIGAGTTAANVADTGLVAADGSNAAGIAANTGLTAGDAATAWSVSPGMLNLAKSFALNLAQSGGDVKQALKNTLLSAGISYGGSAIASGDVAPAEVPTDVPVEPDWKRRGMLALGDTGTTTDVTPGLFGPSMPPAILDVGPIADAGPTMPPAVFDTGGAAMMPSAIPESDPTFGGALQESSPGVYLNGPGYSEQPQSQPQPTPEQKKAQENSKTFERLAKYARALAEMHGGKGTPEGAPRREEGQDDAQYAQTLAQYANLDAQALADAGLTPGTPEYYEYIMKQMDSIIGQVTDGLDPDDASLSDRLRTKTREELDSLERALYVRGQIGQMMGSGRYRDPVTGNDEDVIAPQGHTFRPGVAAYHRGLARSADELAAMRPQEARRFLGGMLDRDPDLYGMEAAANDRATEEMLASQGEDVDWKRRRGMLSRR